MPPADERATRAVEPGPDIAGPAVGAGAKALYSARATRAPVSGRDMARATRAVEEGRGAAPRDALRVRGRDEPLGAALRMADGCAQPLTEPPVIGRLASGSKLRAIGPGDAISMAPALRLVDMRGRAPIAARVAWLEPRVLRARARSTGAIERAMLAVEEGPERSGPAVDAPTVLRYSGLAVSAPTNGERAVSADLRAGEVMGVNDRGLASLNADAAAARARGRLLARCTASARATVRATRAGR